MREIPHVGGTVGQMLGSAKGSYGRRGRRQNADGVTVAAALAMISAGMTVAITLAMIPAGVCCRGSDRSRRLPAQWPAPSPSPLVTLSAAPSTLIRNTDKITDRHQNDLTAEPSYSKKLGIICVTTRLAVKNAQMNDPQYFDHPVLDHLVETVMQLGSELWTTRRRLEVLEKALAEAGSLPHTAGGALFCRPPRNSRKRPRSATLSSGVCTPGSPGAVKSKRPPPEP